MAIKLEGFEPAAELYKPKKRLIVAIDAHEKQGKTHFGLTAPGPIAYFNFDRSPEDVLPKFPGKDILVSDQKIPPDWGNKPQQFYVTVWERFKKLFLAAAEHPRFRSIVVDTATELWEVLRMARLGALAKVMPYQYTPVNAEMTATIKHILPCDKNVIFIHKLRPQYVNDKWNGGYERSGFNQMKFLVQSNISLRFENGDFICRINDCSRNMSLCGLELSGEMCSFPAIASIIFEDDIENWE